MSEQLWREERGGTFVRETLRFRLQVHWTSARTHARFKVLKRDRRGPATLLGSGTTEGIGHAMRAAEKMAERFSSHPTHDQPLVIVVDDDIAVGGAVADTLRDEGYDVVEATSGEGALRRLERVRHPTILVTDLNLGQGMTGLELAAAVRAISPTTGLLVMSADHLDGDDTLLDARLQKPFSVEQLIAAVTVTVRRCGLQ
jgi:CheY-like chemotaxis protein